MIPRMIAIALLGSILSGCGDQPEGKPSIPEVNNPDVPNSERFAALALDPAAIENAYQNGIEALARKDFNEAERWIRIAAQSGLSRAQFSLATLYENGQGVPKDAQQACYWYRVAAQSNHSDALNALRRPVNEGQSKKKVTWEQDNC